MVFSKIIISYSNFYKIIQIPFLFQQIKIAVGEEVVLRGQRNKRESPVDTDEDDGGEDMEDEIIEANEEEKEEERYNASLVSSNQIRFFGAL